MRLECSKRKGMRRGGGRLEVLDRRGSMENRKVPPRPQRIAKQLYPSERYTWNDKFREEMRGS
jgi:hypothetical protein